jgi:hypothetical protein
MGAGTQLIATRLAQGVIDGTVTTKSLDPLPRPGST